MKLILAYIKPAKLPEVTLALRQVEGMPGLTVHEARGFRSFREDKFRQFLQEFGGVGVRG
jgi:nitrogen regulatory protein PII